MRSRAAVRKFIRWNALFVALAILCGSFGCGAVRSVFGSKPKTKLELRGAADLNNCGKSAPATLRVRILQLTDASALAGATLEQVWGREPQFFSGSYISLAEDVVEPGSVKSMPPVALDPKARFVVVVGDFCKPQGECWYKVEARKGTGGVELKLTAGASCLSVTR